MPAPSPSRRDSPVARLARALRHGWHALRPRASSAWLSAVIGAALDAIITVDEAQRITLFNSAAEALFRCRASEVMGLTLDRLIPERLRHGHNQGFAAFMRGVERSRVLSAGARMIALRADGSEFPFEATMSRVDAEGRRLFTVIMRDVTDRRAAEATLRRSRMLLGEAEAIAHLGSWEWQHGSATMHWSDEMYRIYGYAPQECVVSMDWIMEHIPVEDRAPLWTALDIAVKTGASFDFRHRIRRRDGALRHITGRARLLPAVEGEAVRLLGTAQDVTDARDAEAERERSFALLEATLESTADALLVIDAEGRVASHNRKFADMWRLSESAIIGQPDADLVERSRALLSDPDAFTRQIASLYAHPEEDSHDLLELLDGRTIARHSQPYRIGGRCAGRVWSFRDITHWKHAEEMLRRSEASFRSFVEHSPHGIFRSSEDGTLIETNQSLVRMLGYASAAELRRVNGRDIYRDPLERDRLIRKFASRRDSDTVEIEWLRKDGSIITVRLWSHPVRDADGRILYFEGFVEDVTPLRAAEQALRQAEKLAAVGQLVSGVAHELNNPLAAILHFTEDLLQDERSASDVEALGVIRDQARRSRAIVRDLLSFVRSRGAPRERSDVRELLERMTLALQPELRRLGIALDVTIDGRAMPIEIDRAGIEQVVTNLVMNAAQAASAGGHVRLRARAEGGRCRLLVEDDGPGIPADVMPRIFDPFFTTKPAGEGTGLGLSVSLGIIEQHGGTLRAENLSAPAGRGARFTIDLPMPSSEMDGGLMLAPLPDERPARTVPPAAEIAPAAPRVLVIDDERPIRRALTRFFTRRGWSVDEAENGRAALDLLLSAPEDGQSYAVVISDLRMPGVSGVELHDRIAATRPALLDHLLFSTGDVASADAAAFLARTRCPVLQKPFELSALAELVDRMVEARALGTS